MKPQPHIPACGRALRNTVLAVALLGIAGCASVTVRQPAGQSLASLPALITKGASRYIIQSGLSDIRILVYRAGPLAAFGHNHVIRAGVHGDVYLNHDFTLSGFAFSLPLAELRVDVQADRVAEGADFAAQPSSAAIAGTLHNMLGPAVLDAARYPDIRVRSVRIAGPESDPEVTVRITLHGSEHDLTVPVALDENGKRLTATGRFEIRQSDFGITPFSIFGGGLQVADVVKIQFRILAEQE